ncbi:MAG: nitroreductase family protein [Planctomycetota bacterium]|nr:nitroreductase family protein [Planctomycetota bacterium]
MGKEARTDHPVHELITNRWSPYGFAEREVSESDLRSLLEAARWAASSYNEQPWSYIVATRSNPSEYERLLSCLVEGNQAWAKAAPVLMLTVTHLTFSRNDKPNGAAVHDIGLASASLSFEATARGLAVHQMIGILAERARELYEIPEGYTAVTGLAIGHRADPSSLDEKLRERDQAPRQRKPLKEFVFEGKWGSASGLVG